MKTLIHRPGTLQIFTIEPVKKGTKKAAPKKAVAKKTAAKKAAPKKVVAKKTPAKKSAPKKVARKSK